jgi:hypothetical protein
MATGTQKKVGFAICVSAAVDGDLVVGKAYQVLPDKSAAEVDFVRVIDESGEDYLYPARRFVIVNVPPQSSKRLLKAVKKRPA